jgi:hypothetical protein
MQLSISEAANAKIPTQPFSGQSNLIGAKKDVKTKKYSQQTQATAKLKAP